MCGVFAGEKRELCYCTGPNDIGKPKLDKVLLKQIKPFVVLYRRLYIMSIERLL